MKVSNWMIPALLVLFFVPVVLAAGPSATGTNLEQRIRIQEERLPQIEQMVQREREQVERWYQRQRAEQPYKARELAARFPFAERLRWIEYSRMYADRASTAYYFGSAFYNSPFSDYAILLPTVLTEEFTISEMADLLRSESFRAKLVQVEDEYWEPAILRRAARRLLDVMDTLNVELTMDIQQLERNKVARLNAMAQEEKGLQEQVRTILDYLKHSEQRKPQLGVVEAVGYSPQTGYYCMIEGIARDLRPGDAVRGIRVVTVDPEKVVFAKNGTTWTQGLGAPAQPQWQ